MREHIIKNKAARIVVKIFITVLALGLLFALCVFVPFKSLGGTSVARYMIFEYPKVIRDRIELEEQREKFRNPPLGEPGDIDFVNFSLSEYKDLYLYVRPYEFWYPDYREKTSFKVKLLGKKVSAQYTGGQSTLMARLQAFLN